MADTKARITMDTPLTPAEEVEKERVAEAQKVLDEHQHSWTDWEWTSGQNEVRQCRTCFERQYD